MKIRKLKRWKDADRGSFREMDFQCFDKDDEPFLNTADYHWWIATNSFGPIAYAGLYVDGTIAHFTRAGVLPANRGHGVQADLIRARLAWCRRRGIKKVRTYTSATNVASQKNLKACGFRERVSRDKTFFTYTLDLTKGN